MYAEYSQKTTFKIEFQVAYSNPNSVVDKNWTFVDVL